MAPRKILVLNGPNLNLLGIREPHIYGYETLKEIEQKAVSQASSLGHELSFYQTNHEGYMIDRIHQAREEKIDAIIINPGALTHQSIALRDAFGGVNIPFVELHISNVHAREEFRHKSFLSDKAVGVICGLGTLDTKLRWNLFWGIWNLRQKCNCVQPTMY